MKVSDLFSASLPATLARSIIFYRWHHASIKSIYGILEKAEDNLCRGVVYVSFNEALKGDLRLWKTDLFLESRFALEELRWSLSRAADRYFFPFYILRSPDFIYDEETVSEGCEIES